MEIRRNAGIVRLKKKFLQEKKKKTLENKYHVEPIATEEGHSYQTKAFSQTERENNPEN